MMKLSDTGDETPRLHRIVEQYVSMQAVDPKLKESLVTSLEDEIIQEVMASKANEIAKSVDDIEKERLKTVRRKEAVKKLQEGKRAIWSIVALGVLLGLVGNQFTEIIGMWKELFNAFWEITVIAIGAFCVGIYGVFKILYFDIVEDFLKGNSVE